MPDEVRNILIYLATPRRLASIGLFPCMNLEMISQSPCPLESHAAILPWALVRCILIVNALVASQILVGSETFAT